MKKICVLMSTYNGEKYIEEQIDSILSQKDVDVSILVRDDGSKDNTIKILKKYQKKGKLTYYEGSNLGPARSFMDLINKADKYDYYAFSDQDDYWESNKLITAINNLEKEKAKGKLYFSTLKLVDKNLNYIGTTSLPKKISFKQAIIKKYASGCTMVFDNYLKDIIKKTKFNYIYMHDSHILNIALLNNMYVYIDKDSYIKYRQHEKNFFGMKYNKFSIFKDKIDRFIHSKHDVQMVASDLLSNNKIDNKDYYKFLDMVANYRKNKKFKKELKKIKIFGSDEKAANITYKIKLFFNKI